MVENFGLNTQGNKSVGSGIIKFLGGSGPEMLLSAVSLFGALKSGGGSMAMGSLFSGLGQNNYGQDYGQDYGRSYGQNYENNSGGGNSALSFILKMAAGFGGVMLLKGLFAKFANAAEQNKSNIPPLANTTVESHPGEKPPKTEA